MSVLRANKEANIENVVRIPASVQPVNETDTYTDTHDATDVVSAVTFEGQAYEVADIPVADVDELRAALLGILFKGEYDILPSDLTVEYEGGDLTIVHSGPGTLSAAVIDDVEVAFTREAIGS